MTWGAHGWSAFDETMGNIANDVTGTHPGAYFGTPFQVLGKVGGALRFDGTGPLGDGPFVGAADSADWAFGTKDFTIEFWVNFGTPGAGTRNHPSHIFIGNDVGPGLVPKWFFALGGGRLEFLFTSATGGFVADHFMVFNTFTPVPGEWYHLAVTRTGATFTAYVNGVFWGSVTDPASMADANAPLTIGQAESLGFFNGRLDEMTIYGRAVSADDLQAIVTAGSAGKCKPGALTATGVSPGSGGDTGRVTVTVRGEGFLPGAQVSLSRTGAPSIVGIVVSLTDAAIVVRFDLSGRSRGTWDLTIVNGDGATVTTAGAFAIEATRAAQVWVDVVGRGAIRVGRSQRFFLLYGNRGNVDAEGAVVSLGGIPPATEVFLSFDQVAAEPNGNAPGSPRMFDTDTERVVNFVIGPVPPGVTGTAVIDLTVPAAGVFNLKALVVSP